MSPVTTDAELASDLVVHAARLVRAVRRELHLPAGIRILSLLDEFGPLGITVCYDLRFPQLYRRLAQKGAFAFTIPSSFTVPTGEAHWHVLMRARAIENGAFVIAPAQGGLHASGRNTFGHSLIVGPWGEVLAEAGTDPGVILAEIDPQLSLAALAKVPSLHHDRNFTGP